MAPPVRHAASMPSDLDMFLGVAESGGSSMAQEGLCSPDLMGGGGGYGAAPRGRELRHSSTCGSFPHGPQPSLMGDDMFGGGIGGSAIDPNEPPERAALRARREAEKQAAINKKVEQQRAASAHAEEQREQERDLEKIVKQRVQQWKREKKNLRALLASLHEIAPPCSWQPMTLAQLLDGGAVKKGYHKAILAVHPDKQPTDDPEKKVLAQHVFDALRDAWHDFKKMG